MTRRFLALALAAAALLSLVTIAQATTAKKKHAVNDAVVLRVFSTKGSTAVFTGTIKDKVNGAGLVMTTASPNGKPNGFKFTAIAYFKTGSVSVAGNNTRTPNPDGSATYTGTFKAVSGTGALKGVTGSGTLNGSSTSQDPTLESFKLKGSLKY
jgi:hypothetical protein